MTSNKTRSGRVVSEFVNRLRSVAGFHYLKTIRSRFKRMRFTSPFSSSTTRIFFLRLVRHDVSPTCSQRLTDIIRPTSLIGEVAKLLGDIPIRFRCLNGIEQVLFLNQPPQSVSAEEQLGGLGQGIMPEVSLEPIRLPQSPEEDVALGMVRGFLIRDLPKVHQTPDQGMVLGERLKFS